MRFRTTVLSHGGNTAGVAVPDDVVAALGSRKPKVRVTIGGYTYRSSVASMGGGFLLGLSADVRARSGTKVGDEIEVELELDTEPRVVELPADFAEALAGQPSAQAFFQGLSYSRQRGLVEPIVGAKAAETRRRRIEKAVAGLAEGRA